METIHHKTLSDFRSAHGEALDHLFTQLLALLSQAGLVDLEQVMVDGTRIRSRRSTSSMRRSAALDGGARSGRDDAEEEQAEPHSRRVRAARGGARRRREVP